MRHVGLGLVAVVLFGGGCGDSSGTGAGGAGGAGGEGGSACEGTNCALPDLVLGPIAASSISFSSLEVPVGACEVASGCVSGTGRRLLVHFSVELGNAGDAALDLGDPASSDAFEPDFCEASYVVPHFLKARLLQGGSEVREAYLDARCVAAGASFSCDAAQGLAVGSSSTQPDASCDFIDATGLAAGTYELEVTVNPDRTMSESSFDNDTASVSFEFAACDGSICGGSCCPDGFACEDDVCLVPDLHIDGQAAEGSVLFSHQSFLPDSCEVNEGCISGPGRRHLLQFEGRIENLGPGHFSPGLEEGNPLFEFDGCHEHYHFKDFSDYKLLDTGGNVVAQGHKQSFCILDIDPVDPFHPAPHGEPPPGSAGCNFLSAGWADIYGVGTPCQWVDVTGVPEGDYVLRLTVNPLGKIIEGDAGNNMVEFDVHVPEDTPCVPEPEICGDFIDQDCDDVPDNGCFECWPFPETCGDGLDDNCNGVPDDGCTPLPGTDTCATAGELTDSLSYSADITAATAADATFPCGGAGRDVFFHFTLQQEEVVFVSSYSSDMDTTMALYAGDACGGTPLECSAAACATAFWGTQMAMRLGPGDYYIGVKAVDAAAIGRVRIKYQHIAVLEDAQLIEEPGLYDGDTTGADIPVNSTCGPESPQNQLYLAACPLSSMTISSCGLSTFPMTIKLAPDATNETFSECSLDQFGCQSDPDGATVMTFGGDPEGGISAIHVGGKTPVNQGPYTLFVKF